MNSSSLGKVDIIELTKLGFGLKKVIEFNLRHVEFWILSTSRQICHRNSWIHEVGAQEEIESNALPDVITTCHMWL